jgi:cytochrome oxidase assembly protein ShyY1
VTVADILPAVARPRTRRILLLIVALAVAAVCVRLGIWQLHRLASKRAFNAAVVAGTSASPAPVETLAGQGTSVAYRRAEATGRYDAAREILFYGRSDANGDPGSDVLTPLRLDDGDAVLVDRGWIPFDPNQPLPVPGTAAAPAGSVAVTGVLFPPDSSTPPAEGTAPVTIVRRVNLAQIGAQLPYRLLPYYLLLQEQAPAQPAGLPSPPPMPELTEGPHLSYAIQCFSFAAIAVLGYGLLVRRDRRAGSAGRAGDHGAASAEEGG